MWAFNTSTGKGVPYTEQSEKLHRVISGNAVTPVGHFRVYSQQSDGWWNGALGDLYRPKFFNGGIAVHGSTKIPNVPVSHGCVRLTTAAMDLIWAQNYMPLGETVWVHT